MNTNATNFELIRYVDFATRMAGITIVCITCFILLGTFVEIPDFYRPISSGEATHPLTALLFMLTSIVVIGFLNNQGKKNFIHQINLLSLVLAAIALIDNWLAIYFIDGLSSYIGAFEYEKSIGLAINIGSNTSLMFLLLSSSYFCFYMKFKLLGVALGISSQTIVTLSLAGYLFNIPTLYGHMSLTTVSLGLLICLVATIKNLSHTFQLDALAPLSKVKIVTLFSTLILCPLVFLILIIYQSIVDARLFSLLLITLPWIATYLATLYILALEDV